MKLKFDKKEDGEISVTFEGKNFSTKDYIRMVKEIKNKNKIEVEYGGNISQEEKDSVDSMIEEINNISDSDIVGHHNEEIEDVDLDDIPF